MNSLIAAYVLFGLLIVGYIFKLLLSQRTVNRELSELKKKLRG